jgi:selenocysteine lyase/cysteine desulfurase
VTGASNVTGELWPLAELAAVAHEHGARLAVDAAQLTPHRPLDVARLGLDYVALSGHKLYAPFGSGALIGRSDWLRAAPPYLPGGGAGYVGEDGVQWADGPARHEGGTPNLIGAVALATACDTLTGIGWDRLREHEDRLQRALRDRLAGLPGLSVLRLWDGSVPRLGIVSFTIRGLPAGQIAARLSDEHAIAVRHGKFCAHPLVRQLTGGPDAVRASVGIGSTAGQVARLAGALREIVGTPC